MASRQRSSCYPPTKYYPVDRKEGECDAKTWLVSGKIGEESAYGEIQLACCKGKCRYILKYQPFGKPERAEMFGADAYEDVTEEMIKHEINIQNSIANTELTIPVVDSWFCKKGGVMIMKALKTTARDLIMNVYSSERILRNIIITCLGMIRSLHFFGFYHGDTHLNNFMVNFESDDAQDAEEENDEIEKYEIYDYKYYFIDFGRSGIFSQHAHEKRSQILEDYRKLASDLQNIIDTEKNEKRKRILEKISEGLVVYIKTITQRT